MSLIEFQNVFPMINFDVWDRLEHVQTIFETVGLWGSIFHCLSVCKTFIRELLIKALQTLKSSHFDTKSSQIWQWKIDPSNPVVSKMVQTCPNRSQTSKLIIRNTFRTSISDIRITFEKPPQPPSLKKIPRCLGPNRSYPPLGMKFAHIWVFIAFFFKGILWSWFDVRCKVLKL